MGTKYDQLSVTERGAVARLRAEGRSIRHIAAVLDRSASTIARELKRNSGRQIGYRASYAQQQTQARCWRGSRLERDADLRLRGRKGGSSALHIQDRVSIEKRPATVDDRSVPGHREADLMMFARYDQALLTLHERSSRLLIAMRPNGKHAGPIASAIASLLQPLPQPLRQTITFDNGTEVARHHELHRLDIQTFFCDPYAPWQKGGIENAIGRMRRRIPRKTDLATLTTRQLSSLLCAYNNTPRKCLDWQSPAEFFWRQVLHLECESTSPLSRG